MDHASLKLLLGILTAVSLCACSGSLKISASKVDKAELKNYKTYAWIVPGDTALNTRRDDKIYAGLIESSANKELQKKGMTIDNQNPDVVFMFDTHIDEKIEYRKIADNRDASFGFGGYAYGYHGAGYYTAGYNPNHGFESTHILVDEGTLSYSMFDRKTGKMLWKGAATQNLDNKTNVEATIKKATRSIFSKLPIKHK